MRYTPKEQEAIRTWIVEQITLVADNDSAIQPRLSDAAARGVLEGMGTPAPGRAEYEMMLHGAGDVERYEYARAAGSYVVSELTDIIEEHGAGDGFVVSLLGELLNLGDSTQAEMLGEHYLPESVGDIPWDGVE